MTRGRIYKDRVTTDVVDVDQINSKGIYFDPIRPQIRFRTQGNIANLVAGAPLAPDGVNVATGDRILVGQQIDPVEQGFYTVLIPGNGSNGTWVRSSDMLVGGLPISKLLVGVQEGTDAGKLFYLDTVGQPVVGTDALPFTEFAAFSGPTAARQTIQIPVSGTSGAGTIDSTTIIPVGNIVFSVGVNVQVPFDGSATVEVGSIAVPNLVFTLASADLSMADTYVVEQTTNWTIDSVLRVTIGGIPTFGSALVTVVYGPVNL